MNHRASTVYAIVAAIVLLLGGGRTSAQGSEAAREARAAQLVKALENPAMRRRPADAWEALRELAGPLVRTTAASGASVRLARLRWEVGLEVVGGAADFRADVAPGKKGTLVLTYVLGDDEAVWEDFEILEPVPDTRAFQRTGNLLQGTGALCHRAPFLGDVRVSVVGIARAAGDYGPIVVDPDEEAGERFLVGCLNNSYFGIKYGRNRSRSTGDALLFCGRGAESRATDRPTQLLGLLTPPTPRTGQPITATLAWNGKTVSLQVGSGRASHEVNAATQTIRRKRVGMFLRRSGFALQGVVIEGTPEPAWLDARAAVIRERLQSLDK